MLGFFSKSQKINMTDLSGIWTCGYRIYLFTQVKDKFTWKLMTKQGEQTGIGQFTGPDAIEAIWDYHGGVKGQISQGTGCIINQNGTEVQDWGGREILKKPT